MTDAAAEEPGTLQSGLEVAEDASGGADPAPTAPAPTDPASPTIDDPVAFLRYLDVSGRFHRDSRIGRVFHRGMVSLRENRATDSLHISVEGNRVTAHVDGVSPLAVESEGGSGYSVRRAAAHNLVGMAQDLVTLLRGRQGDHRSVLDCEWVANTASSTAVRPARMDPAASAWSVQLEARVTGTLDAARLQRALNAALGQTPERDVLEVVECPDDAALDAARARLQSTAVALTELPPLRLYLARHPAGDWLMLNLNHAAGDGFGALQVLRSIAAAYAPDATLEPTLEFPALSDLPVRPSAPPRSILVRAYKTTMERLRDVLARPAPLAADQPGEHPGYGFHLVVLPADETPHPGDDEERPRISSTDCLMAALHLTIAEWNRRHDAPGRRIGVLAPANLRPQDWRDETVGNFSVTARVSTSPREHVDPASARWAINAQAARNRRTRTGVALIAALDRNGLLALWAKQSVIVLEPITGNRRVDASLLSNLGRIDEAPCFGPEAGETVQLWFSVPARSPLSLSLGAVTVNGRLHLTFRHPHRLLSPDAVSRFADSYVHHLRSIVER
jgi:NRPS condensation-like uncharacterized protein